MKYISLNWTLALKFSIGKKKRMRDCRILMAHDCTLQRHWNPDPSVLDIPRSNQCAERSINAGIILYVQKQR